MADWKGKTRGGSFGYFFFIKLIQYIGVRAAYVFLAFVVVYFIPFAPKATACTWRYARKTLKLNRLKSVGLLFRNYYRLGQTLIDKIAIGSGMTDKYHFKFENYQEFLDVLNSQQGVIMMGGHIGNWEIGAPFFGDYGKNINIVMYDAEYQKIKEMLEKNSTGHDYKVIPVNNDTLTPVFQITEALNRHEYVCFQGDRYVNADKLLTATFMGREADFPSGPFLLASRLKVPVVFYFAMREKPMTYHYRFTIAQPVPRTRDRKPEQALLEQYVANFEKILKEYPEQWFNYYDFWKSPEGA